MNFFVNSELGQIILLFVGLVIADLLSRRFLVTLVRRTVRSHNFDSIESEKKREDTVISVVNTSLIVLLFIIGLLGALVILHVNIAGLVTGAGVIGVVIGLGGQSVIKDFLAGFFILVENQYRVGDVITLSTVSGVVEKINLRITKLRDLDGNVHIIPNGAVQIITNQTFGYSNVNLNIGISYDADIDMVKKLINQTGLELANDSQWQQTIVEPISFLRVDEFADSSVTIKMLGRVIPGMQWGTAGEFRARLKKAFDKHGIEIPFPQRVIHEAPKKHVSHKK